MKNHIAAITITTIGILTPHALADLQEFDTLDAWSDAVGGNYTTIDFTGFEDNTPITEQYAHLGVHFTTFDVISDCNCHQNDSWGLQGFDEIIIEFDTPVNWVAAFFPGDMNFELWRDGQHVGTSSLFGGPGPGHFGGVISDESFDTLKILDPVFFSSDIDDFLFGPPIPAPGVLAVMIPPLVWSRRRR